MDWSTLGFPVLHHLPEFAQTHVHWVGDAIQPSHPHHPLLLLPSSFPSIRVFSNELALCIGWSKYWHFIFKSLTWNPSISCLKCSWLVQAGLKLQERPWARGTSLRLMWIPEPKNGEEISGLKFGVICYVKIDNHYTMSLCMTKGAF